MKPGKNPASPCVLAINGGSSSIRFALYETGATPRRRLAGKIDRIGLNGTTMIVDGPQGSCTLPRRIAAADHRTAAGILLDWLEAQAFFTSIKAFGHRVVHGMTHFKPERVTTKLLAELHRITPYVPDHLPRELELIEAIRTRYPKLPQVACFDTAFHRTMPRVAKLLAIRRLYQAKGVEHYGFHCLSYAYLMEELARVDPAAAKGRLILAHLGQRREHGRRSSPQKYRYQHGLYTGRRLGHEHTLGRSGSGAAFVSGPREKMTPAQLEQMVNHKSGLFGVSETSSDVRDLLVRESRDVRAADFYLKTVVDESSRAH